MDSYEIYLMYINELNFYKIGVSKNSKKRLLQLQTGCPYAIEIKEIFKSRYPYKTESILHRKFKSYKADVNEIKLKGEWFCLTSEQVDLFLHDCIDIEYDIDFLIKSENKFILKS